MYFMVLSKHVEHIKLHIILKFRIYLMDGYVSRSSFVFRIAKMITRFRFEQFPQGEVKIGILNLPLGLK